MRAPGSRYEQAGVSIDAGQQAVDLMKEAVTSTHDANVLAGVGAFGGLFSLTESLAGLAKPTLVGSTDSVGTKVKLAATVGRYTGIGHDVVNHCLNDIACAGEGVKPLFFLDYFASSKIEPEIVAQIVTGIATACRQVGCALLGGETAEMPGVYLPSEFDVVGTVVGLVDQNHLFPRPSLEIGDVLLGLPSSGPHTNGYSLIRSIFAETPLERDVAGIGPLGQALLRPHRAYLNELGQLKSADIKVQGIAHVTGGGLTENLPRAVPDGFTIRVNQANWPVPPLFQFIQSEGGVSATEMRRVFNMGIGLVIIIKPDDADRALSSVEGRGWLIGEVISGQEMEWS